MKKPITVPVVRHTPATLALALGWSVPRVHEEAAKLAAELDVTHATEGEAFALLAGLAEEERARAIDAMNAGCRPPQNRPGARVRTTVYRRFFHVRPVKRQPRALVAA